MIILAADTTTAINAVAVCDDDRVLAETIVYARASHTERLLETVDWVLREADKALSDVGLLAISAGPGSYTGLRVGAATWKGLALGAGLPLVAVPTLHAMARLVPIREGVVCPLLDARMGEVYSAVYDYKDGQRTQRTPPRVGPVDLLLDELDGPIHFLGDGADRYRERILERCPEAHFAEGLCSVPRAAAVAAEGLALLNAGASTDPALANPVYLRQSQPEEARRRAASPEVLG